MKIFKANMRRTCEIERIAAEEEKNIQERRRVQMNQFANSFEMAVGDIVKTVSAASTELEAPAATLSSTAQRSQDIARDVASAADATSSNVQSVASATEELSSMR
ncbi:hypothetical protein [Bradyrhizobium manausense]|uniref:hypothetical protein n=1 Tax=Bradyrhizobium manausense TaxID=989370 RepID=UPI001BAC8402|nr:hypothetical protein [Bradyrhizobium manausense]MBR0725545.1 hypothetical protein [Bradyrhizobium manausense]